MMMMSTEKEREIEREEECLDHFIHDHPLTLQIESNDKGDSRCQGCARFFLEEAAYVCKTCNNKKIIHEECAKMPREILHPLHPQHTLLQKKGNASQLARCAVCEDQKIPRIGYFCSSTCDFQLHLNCMPTIGVKSVSDEQISIHHPSHPEHQLILSKKILSFKCDACGVMETGRCYVCVACQYWIHEWCATLPPTTEFHHHPHPLSLAFYLPVDYIKYLDRCDVCDKNMFLNGWVYHCQSCTYVVHIKCAFRTSSSALAANSSDTATAPNVEGVVIQFPIENVHEELITSFVIKERGEEVLTIPHDNQKFLFPIHNHQLTVVSSSISEIHDDDDDDNDSSSGGGEEERISKLVCDACTLPIFSKKIRYQSCVSTSDYYKYLSCDECKYILHWECFHLPRELPNHPLHPKHHKLILEGCDKLVFNKACTICTYCSNGLFYNCTECDFKADVKCASLPNPMKHAAHPKHYLYLKLATTEDDSDEFTIQFLCGGCRGFVFNNHMLYKCSSCNFSLCMRCVFVPATNKHESDKHLLPLRYDAKLDRLGDFFCNKCERKMNHRAWMYRCDDCDTSFHPRCFDTTSGPCRNMKFGQQYGVSADIHPHPLTFQLLTTKLYCDVCRFRVYEEEVEENGRVYDVDQRGFHCFSCNFFMCLANCEYEIWAID